MKTITVKVPEHIETWLNKRARALRVPKSKLIREAVEAQIEQTKGKSVYEMVKEFCGVSHSGVPDLSTNMKHLKNFGRS